MQVRDDRTGGHGMNKPRKGQQAPKPQQTPEPEPDVYGWTDEQANAKPGVVVVEVKST